ncbi:N-acyl homoserine lactonase family protein [Paenibacillus sp. GCM10027628]|uniref:N-acyl homoserine lactonase family protein n=1 Tax=Paenibacillus sp. GCM10027628 TaxID=3273413 RepID=UPI003644116F
MKTDIKVHILHCGKVKVDHRLAYKDSTIADVPPVDERSEAYQLWLPVSCYLIEHPEGDVVIDAGWSEMVRTDPEQHLGHAYKYCHPQLPPGQSIKEHLSARHRTAEQIKCVVISHLDVDHISGLHLLAGAQSFIVSEPEWNAAKPYQIARCKDITLEPFVLEPIPFGPYQLGKDLYGDETIYLIYTPGHTAGLISTLVRVRDGWVLLVSDAAYSEKSWNELVLPGHTSDEQQARESLQWIRDFSQRKDCLAVIANHDPAVQEIIW